MRDHSPDTPAGGGAAIATPPCSAATAAQPSRPTLGSVTLLAENDDAYFSTGEWAD